MKLPHKSSFRRKPKSLQADGTPARKNIDAKGEEGNNTNNRKSFRDIIIKKTGGGGGAGGDDNEKNHATTTTITVPFAGIAASTTTAATTKTAAAATATTTKVGTAAAVNVANKKKNKSSTTSTSKDTAAKAAVYSDPVGFGGFAASTATKQVQQYHQTSAGLDEVRLEREQSSITGITDATTFVGDDNDLGEVDGATSTTVVMDPTRIPTAKQLSRLLCNITLHDSAVFGPNTALRTLELLSGWITQCITGQVRVGSGSSENKTSIDDIDDSISRSVFNKLDDDDNDLVEAEEDEDLLLDDTASNRKLSLENKKLTIAIKFLRSILELGGLQMLLWFLQDHLDDAKIVCGVLDVIKALTTPIPTTAVVIDTSSSSTGGGNTADNIPSSPAPSKLVIIKSKRGKVLQLQRQLAKTWITKGGLVRQLQAFELHAFLLRALEQRHQTLLEHKASQPTLGQKWWRFLSDSMLMGHQQQDKTMNPRCRDDDDDDDADDYLDSDYTTTSSTDDRYNKSKPSHKTSPTELALESIAAFTACGGEGGHPESSLSRQEQHQKATIQRELQTTIETLDSLTLLLPFVADDRSNTTSTTSAPSCNDKNERITTSPSSVLAMIVLDAACQAAPKLMGLRRPRGGDKSGDVIAGTTATFTPTTTTRTTRLMKDDIDDADDDDETTRLLMSLLSVMIASCTMTLVGAVSRSSSKTGATTNATNKALTDAAIRVTTVVVNVMKSWPSHPQLITAGCILLNRCLPLMGRQTRKELGVVAVLGGVVASPNLPREVRNTADKVLEDHNGMDPTATTTTTTAMMEIMQIN